VIVMLTMALFYPEIVSTTWSLMARFNTWAGQ
jgi:hypothetical protein